MPSGNQLDVQKTFESQKDFVSTTIVPNLMKIRDLDTSPIGEGVIYEMIHQRHRNQRDDLRNKQKSEEEKKKDREQKHLNSRRLEVKINILFYCNHCLFTNFYKIEKEKKIKDYK